MSLDRNQKARQDFALAQQRRAFAQAVQAGQTGLIDRFGSFIRAGDGVLWFPQQTFPTGVVVQVVDVGPNLDLNVRPGTMKLSLLLEVQLNYPAGSPAIDLLRLNRPAETVGQPLAEVDVQDGEQVGAGVGDGVQETEGETDGGEANATGPNAADVGDDGPTIITP